jgi:alpha-acetolactate decarboxylase
MKKILLFLALFAIATMAMAQIKIATDGNVGIGTNTTTNGKLQIAYNGSEFAFHASNKSDGKSYFGSHCANKDPWINFYHPQEGYNKVRFKQSILSSDSTLKTEIAPLKNTTAILKQIKTYSYYFKSDSIYFLVNG